MTKAVLVSGAGGHIKSTLVDSLLAWGYRVVGLDRYIFGEHLLKDTLRHPELTFSINHHGHAKVAAAVRDAGVKQSVLASSCSVFGTGKSANLTEEGNPFPITTYAKANLMAEKDTLEFEAEITPVEGIREIYEALKFRTITIRRFWRRRTCSTRSHSTVRYFDCGMPNCRRAPSDLDRFEPLISSGQAFIDVD